MLKNQLTLVIHTCDKFSDLWDAHIYLLNKNWGTRGIKTLLVTDKETSRKYEGIEIIAAGDGAELTDRILVALKHIDTEYMLVTLDDYFPIHQISNGSIENLIEIMESDNIDYLRLFNDPTSRKKVKGYKDIYEISLDINYAVNLYQGIWRTSFVNKTIKTQLNAWDYEVSLTKVAKMENARCYLSKGKEFEILDVVRKGKLLNKANKYLKRHQLYNGEREVISVAEELRIRIFSLGKQMLPKNVAILVKRILTKMGVKFYSGITY